MTDVMPESERFPDLRSPGEKQDMLETLLLKGKDGGGINPEDLTLTFEDDVTFLKKAIGQNDIAGRDMLIESAARRFPNGTTLGQMMNATPRPFSAAGLWIKAIQGYLINRNRAAQPSPVSRTQAVPIVQEEVIVQTPIEILQNKIDDFTNAVTEPKVYIKDLITSARSGTSNSAADKIYRGADNTENSHVIPTVFSILISSVQSFQGAIRNFKNNDVSITGTERTETISQAELLLADYIREVNANILQAFEEGGISVDRNDQDGLYFWFRDNDRNGHLRNLGFRLP